MALGIVLVVKLWAVEGKEQEFAEYEAKAASTMRQFGGSVDKVLKPLDPSQGDPTEVHVVSFPSRIALENYMRGAGTEEMATRRAACVQDTSVEMFKQTAGTR